MEQRKITEVLKKGKSKEEAIEAALLDLEISEEDAEIEVVEEASKGFLGLLGGKPAVVRVKAKEKADEKIENILTDILHAMELSDFSFDFEETDDYLKTTIDGEEMGILIGHRGETLDALQFLTNLVVNKNQTKKTRVILDVGDYRSRREKTLQELAVKLARKVKSKKQSVVLEPMNPQERRIIHSTLQDFPGVTTYSEGDEPYRKVVITLKERD